jgi:hypothetical protein
MILNEKFGIPNTILDIINKNTEIILHLNDININVDYIDFKTTINLKFKNDDSYHSTIKYNEFIYNNFKNCVISISIPNTPKKELILKSLAHELLHAYELYNLKSELEYTKWKSTNALNHIKQDQPRYILYLKDLFYLALPHEIRARNSTLYLQLYKVDKKMILTKLKQTREWEYYNVLETFNSTALFNRILQEDHDKVISNIILFNKLLDLNFKISNINDVNIYLQRMEKYFKLVASKYKKKMLKIAVSIINESVLDYTTEEPITLSLGLLTYDDYIEYYNKRTYKEMDYKKIITL